MSSPELERFLSRRDVDLAVTDQIESLQVRVREGMAILGRRREHAVVALTRSARALTGWLTGSCVLAALTLPGTVISTATGSGPVATASFLAMVVLGFRLAQTLRDRAQLASLDGRYDGQLEQARSKEELLSFAEGVLEDTRTLAGPHENRG
jgi:hypothetical protein